MGWVSCSFLISSPTLLPLILIKHSGSWELTPFPCSYNLLTSWPLSPEWPELLAQFSSSPQGLHHVHWAQVLHPFLHYLSYQFSATSWISPPKETMYHLWNVNWNTSYSEHTSHRFKSQPPEQPPHTHTHNSLTLSFNPHHVHHFLLSSDFTSLLGHPWFPGFHFNYFLENALNFLPITPPSSLPAHTSHPSPLVGPSLLPASPSTHRGHHRTPGWAPGTTQWLPSKPSILHMVVCT